jgi:hypothetical protein
MVLGHIGVRMKFISMRINFSTIFSEDSLVIFSIWEILGNNLFRTFHYNLELKQTLQPSHRSEMRAKSSHTGF